MFEILRLEFGYCYLEFVLWRVMYLSNLTWEEVSYYLKENNSLIIPIGISEQHAKHLPLNTDTLVAEYTSAFLSEQTGILIAPTFNYGVGLPCDRFFPWLFQHQL